MKTPLTLPRRQGKIWIRRRRSSLYVKPRKFNTKNHETWTDPRVPSQFKYFTPWFLFKILRCTKLNKVKIKISFGLFKIYSTFIINLYTFTFTCFYFGPRFFLLFFIYLNWPKKEEKIWSEIFGFPN